MKRYRIYKQEYIYVFDVYDEDVDKFVYTYRMGEPIYIGWIDRCDLYMFCIKGFWHNHFVNDAEIVGNYIQSTTRKNVNFVLTDMDNNILDYYEIVRKENNKYINRFHKIQRVRRKPCYKIGKCFSQRKYRHMYMDKKELHELELEYKINLNSLCCKKKGKGCSDDWYYRYTKSNSRCWKDQSKRKRQYKARSGLCESS